MKTGDARRSFAEMITRISRLSIFLPHPTLTLLLCEKQRRRKQGPRSSAEGNPRITQEELAARIQVLGLRGDQTAISKIEAGRRPVLDVEVVAFSKALSVSANWLLWPAVEPLGPASKGYR